MLQYQPHIQLFAESPSQGDKLLSARLITDTFIRAFWMTGTSAFEHSDDLIHGDQRVLISSPGAAPAAPARLACSLSADARLWWAAGASRGPRCEETCSSLRAWGTGPGRSLEPEPEWSVLLIPVWLVSHHRPALSKDS